MLDIKFVREHADAIQNDLQRRGITEKVAWVDDLVRCDAEYRQLLFENQKLRARRNEITDEINQLRKEKKEFSQKVAEAKGLPQKIKESDEQIAVLADKILYYRMRLPNILDADVPSGKDSTQNVVVREWGTKPAFDFELRPHGELLEEAGLANFEKAGEVAGNGFYYLFGDIVRMELALMQFAIDMLSEKGYVAVYPPLMLRRKPYEGVTDLADFETMMYKIADEDLFLIATSEHPIGALLMDAVLEESELPKKFVGLSPCFRREVGSRSIDTKGIFRVHHFNKIEQFIFCTPEDSKKFHEELLANAESIYQKLELPYRVVNICTGDIGTVAAKKYDIEAWMPRENMYREVVSCSNCTSYQAVRLNTKFRRGDAKEFVHTLNSTAIATGRTIRAICEIYQQKDGTIAVPQILQKYLGKNVIGERRKGN